MREENPGIICGDYDRDVDCDYDLRFKYSAEVYDSGTIEEEQTDERGNGESLKAKYMQGTLSA